MEKREAPDRELLEATRSGEARDERRSPCPRESTAEVIASKRGANQPNLHAPVGVTLEPVRHLTYRSKSGKRPEPGAIEGIYYDATISFKAPFAVVGADAGYTFEIHEPRCHAHGRGSGDVAVEGGAPRPAASSSITAMTGDSATVAEEEYLQSLFWLYEAGLPMTGANVARAMQLSAPTVHEMIGRLERDGYITRSKDRTISFTESGSAHAESVVSRHRLIERFLTDVLGIPWDEVHEEAERLEHAMSPVLEARMLAAIGDAKTCPHGHPIIAGTRIDGVPLADVEVGASVGVLRFENEAEDLLHYLKAAGIEPGLRGTLAQRTEDEVTIETADGERCSITASVAETVSVTADPSPPPRTALPEQLVLGKRYGR
jgi:DtxR family Mn-dependent transcriptional regulator